MKAAIAFSLATVAAALPAPQAAEIKEATTCPGLNGGQALSNNNQAYKITCNQWVDSDTVIRITPVEEGGYKSCLTACDGTIGCGVVQYIASDEAQTKGSCTIFPKNATIKHTDSPSWTLATPIEKPAGPKRFGGLALRSASPIHFSSVNANGLKLYLQKNTTTYCPSGVEGLDCADFNSNTTIFSQGTDSDTLSLSVSVPGGQQVYVTKGDEKLGQLAGELKFTQAHSASTSGPALYNGFSITDAGNLQFEGKDWYACEVDDFNNGYGIWAVSRLEGEHAGEGCLGFSFRTSEVGEDVKGAWQYA